LRVLDKVLVVTGGGKGIGREVALELLRRGARVAAVDVSESGLAQTTALAGPMEGRLTTHVLDITDRSAVEALPALVTSDHGAVEGLVNVAGIIHRFVPIGELSVDEIERVVAVNFWGTVYMCKAFLPLLQARPEATLVNVSSMGALIPFPGQSAYGASKAAVKLFTEGLIAELRGSTVRTAVVFPGAVGTNMPVNSERLGWPAAQNHRPGRRRTADRRRHREGHPALVHRWGCMDDGPLLARHAVAFDRHHRRPDEEDAQHLTCRLVRR
jgi:NAD(P)-dependent dehydrogenase (short-subunit alcohol dehydrogenase family)